MASVVRFSGCIVNIAQRTILSEGEPVAVAPLVFDCIAYLIRHRERAVGRDELVAAVWGKVEVSDAALAKTILTARRAIGDDGETQRYLRTVPRFGYRWTAETYEIGEAQARAVAAPPAEAGPPAPPPTAARPRFSIVSRSAAIVLAVVLLAVAGFAAWRQREPVPMPVSGAEGERPAGVVAVLPAEVLATAEDGWLRLGLMDLIATRLGAAGVRVLPSDNIVRWVPAGTRGDEAIAILRKATERSRLVVPAVRRSGSTWTVRTQLIETDGSAQALEAQADSVIAAAEQVCDRLLERLGKAALAPQAHGAGFSEAELVQRIDAARLAHQPEQALALIDASAPAQAQQSSVRLRKAQIALDLGRVEPAREQLAALATEVPVESDPSLVASVQRSLCIAQLQLGRLDEALAACDASLRLLDGRGTPSDLARTYNDRGIARLMQGRYDLAGRDFARAKIAANLAADALLLAQIEGNESNMQSLQGHYAEVAAAQARIGRRFEQFGMTDEYVKALIGQTTAWISLLHPLEALEASSLAVAQAPRVEHAGTRVEAYLVRANALELSGRFGEARVLLDRALAQTSDSSLKMERGIARAGLARIELASGAPDAALPLARQALDDLDTPQASAHRADAWLSGVRSLGALHRLDEAHAEARSFSAWAAEVDAPSITLLARLAEADQAAAADQPAQAQIAYEAALDLARHWSVPDLLCETIVSFGRFLISRGDLPQASAIVGQVSGYAEVDFDAALLQAQLYRALNQPAAFAAALEQARRLAGDRAIPPALTAISPVVGPKSSFGNDAERNRQ